MRKLVLSFCVLLNVTALLAADFSIESRAAATFPAYAEVQAVHDLISGPDYDAAVQKLQQVAVVERVVYAHDGVKVSAYVATPKAKAKKDKLPVIVFNRGSYVVPQPLPMIVQELATYASNGYLVIAPTLRGSDGTQGKDELGGGDFDDLATAVSNVAQFGPADASHIYMAGESRGGIMTYFAIARGLPIRAAAVWGAITDIGDYLSRVDKEGKLAHAVWPDFDEKKDEILRSRSAISWPEKLKVPVLIMHGGADWIVPPQQSLRLATALQDRGQEYALIIFAADGHILAKNRVRRDDEVLRWFAAH